MQLSFVDGFFVFADASNGNPGDETTFDIQIGSQEVYSNQTLRFTYEGLRDENTNQTSSLEVYIYVQMNVFLILNLQLNCILLGLRNNIQTLIRLWNKYTEGNSHHPLIKYQFNKLERDSKLVSTN